MADQREQDNRKIAAALTEAAERGWGAQTSAELADLTGLTAGRAHRAVLRLVKKGHAEQAGEAANGGKTWRRTEGQ